MPRDKTLAALAALVLTVLGFHQLMLVPPAAASVSAIRVA